jgi:hypothetical protein
VAGVAAPRQPRTSPLSGTGSSNGGSSGACAGGQQQQQQQQQRVVTPDDTAASLQRVHSTLAELKVRKQRITGGLPLEQLQQAAESASERLLLVKLQEAGRIMEEQQAVSRRARGRTWEAVPVPVPLACPTVCTLQRMNDDDDVRFVCRTRRRWRWRCRP